MTFVNLAVGVHEEGRFLQSQRGHFLWRGKAKFLRDSFEFRAGLHLLLVLQPEISFDGRIPMVFDGVVRPAGQALGDERPFVAESLLYYWYIL